MWTARRLGLSAGEKLKKVNHPAHLPRALFLPPR
nr:MAG TPA: hypothetical protein [Caudoviricetes sp.]